jgi:hypothetical protein
VGVILAGTPNKTYRGISGTVTAAGLAICSSGKVGQTCFREMIVGWIRAICRLFGIQNDQQSKHGRSGHDCVVL